MQPGDLRVQQLVSILSTLSRSPTEAVLLAGDLNLRNWEATKSKVGDDGGKHWHDVWHLAGADAANASTCNNRRYDRVYCMRGSALTYVPNSFRLLAASESDHAGIQCRFQLRTTGHTTSASLRGLARPLRRGARGRTCGHGVARRPTKFDACAKMEPSSMHDPGGPQYYCGKLFEKPRIPLAKQLSWKTSAGVISGVSSFRGIRHTLIRMSW